MDCVHIYSHLTWENQPIIYSDYSLFVAEVASNFHRYFFIMPTLARFKLEIQQRVERGQGLTADDMNALMADLFSEGYGGEMHVGRDRVGITWATFGHLYVDYYVYQYATGLSGANALAQRVLSGGQPAVEDYLGFLKTGSSRYPLDTLALAGVDLTTPDAVEVTFGVLASLVDKLEALI